MSQASVSLQEIFAAISARAASLVPETAGYLTLAVADAVLRRSFALEDSAIFITVDGAVLLGSKGSSAPPAEAARRVRSLFARLLAAASGSMPGLAAAARERDEVDVDQVASEIEAALIPLNRAAAKRALARLVRETLRAKEAKKLKLSEAAPARAAKPAPPPAPMRAPQPDPPQAPPRAPQAEARPVVARAPQAEAPPVARAAEAASPPVVARAPEPPPPIVPPKQIAVEMPVAERCGAQDDELPGDATIVDPATLAVQEAAFSPEIEVDIAFPEATPIASAAAPVDPSDEEPTHAWAPVRAIQTEVAPPDAGFGAKDAAGDPKPQMFNQAMRGGAARGPTKSAPAQRPAVVAGERPVTKILAARAAAKPPPRARPAPMRTDAALASAEDAPLPARTGPQSRADALLDSFRPEDDRDAMEDAACHLRAWAGVDATPSADPQPSRRAAQAPDPLRERRFRHDRDAEAERGPEPDEAGSDPYQAAVQPPNRARDRVRDWEAMPPEPRVDRASSSRWPLVLFAIGILTLAVVWRLRPSLVHDLWGRLEPHLHGPAPAVAATGEAQSAPPIAAPDAAPTAEGLPPPPQASPRPAGAQANEGATGGRRRRD